MGTLPPQQVATSTLTSGTVYTPAHSLTDTGRGADLLAEVRDQVFRLLPSRSLSGTQLPHLFTEELTMIA